MISCVDPYHLETNTFEDAIVVEATITNELKKQEIKLSRTYRFEEDGPTFETGAEVYITDDQGVNYEFEELNGKYVSVLEFQASPNRQYQLNILTSDGKSYISTNEKLTTESPIENINPIVVTKNGEIGVKLGVSSYDPSSTSKYYRYEYEETYKIIAPKYSPLELFYNAEDDLLYTALRQNETKTCYTTVKSNSIILANTNDLSEDRVDNFEVRFISNQNYIISHRYSILVRQYVQNLPSYTFYKTLKDLSGSGSILSQNQPGFFYGNLKSANDPNEKVIGFFDVSSVSKKRIFFNYVDLFPGQPLPPYFNSCENISFDMSDPGPPFGSSPRERLIILLNQGGLRFYSQADTVYNMVVQECGDCTTFSSNIIPEFWID